MSLLDQLSDPLVWEKYYEYKCSLACPKDFTRALRHFIDERAYEPLCGAISRGEAFSLPRRALISKQYSQKKRVVYLYPPGENILLKLLTYLLLRTYDRQMAPGLFSFRPGRSAGDALRMLRRRLGREKWYGYKADISDYFNSLPVEKLLPMLQACLGEDEALYAFLRRLLKEPRVWDRGQIIEEEKGIMAGTPLSSFYANLYLKEMDEHFAALGIPYARYSDDIILFGKTEDEVRTQAEWLRAYLAEKGLVINPDKEKYFGPEEPWTFLGFICREGILDISPVSVKKLKAKMRRKTRALARWTARNGLPREKGARAFIRVFNRKLFESPGDHELSWSHWFFPLIGTNDSLKIIDRYAQDCLRYLLSGSRSKGRFQVRYEDLKALGYQSLVHAYYK